MARQARPRRSHARRRRLKPWVMLFALLGFVAVAALHIVLARTVTQPIIYGDELGYIENARYLVHGGLAPALTYYPGLSLLLVPAWMITTHVLAIWRTAQAINIAAALAVGLEAVILGSVCGLDRKDRWLVGLLASLYPAILLFSDVALSESLFQAMFGALVLLIANIARRAARYRPSVGMWAVVGLLAALVTMVHPRGLAVVVAVVLAAVVLLRPLRYNVPSLVSLGAGLTGGLAALRIALVATRAENIVGRGDYAASTVVDRNLGIHAFGGLVSGVIGRVFYLSVASAGLVPFAVVVGAIAAVSVVRGSRDPRLVVHAFVGLAGLGVVAVSVVLVNGGVRADQLLHGRYIEGVIMPLLVIGAAELIRMERSRWWLFICVALGSLGASAAALDWSHALSGLSTELNSINVLAIEPLVRRLSNNQVEIGPLLLVGLAAIVLLAVVGFRWPRIGVALLSLAFLLSAIDTQTHYVIPGSKAKARETVLVDAIQQASTTLGVPSKCVAYDGVIDVGFLEDRLLLGTQAVQVMAPGAKPCGPFVITQSLDFATRYPGAQLVAKEDDIDNDLYVLPGPTQNALQTAGWILPTDTPGPLPVDGQIARIATKATVTLAAGASRSVTAVITNVGHVTPWPAHAGLKEGAWSVRVAVWWFAPGQPVVSPGETGSPLTTSAVELPRSLLPGQSVDVTLPFVARAANGKPLAAGRYNVRVSVYQEFRGSFAGATTVPVVVHP